MHLQSRCPTSGVVDLRQHILISHSHPPTLDRVEDSPNVLLGIILELVAHSLKLIGFTCRVCTILRHVLILHPPFTTRLASIGLSFVSLFVPLSDFLEGLSQELLTDVTELVCILLWVYLDIF